MCGSVRNAPWTKPRVVRHLRAVGGRRDDATTRPSARRTLDLGRLDGLVRETGRGSSGMWVAGRSSRREACRIQRHQASLPSFQGGDPAPRHLRGTGAAVPALRRGLCGALSRASVSRRIRPRRDRPLLAQEGPRPSAYAPPPTPRGLGIRCRRASEQCDLDAGVEGELVDQAGRTEGSASGAEQIFHCALERFGVVFAADQGVEHEPVESGERSGRSLGP